MTGLWISCLAFVALSGVSALTDYYKTLGLEPSALPKDVKKAFRQLALKYHPDKNKSPDAEKQFREIAEGRPEYPHSILFLAHKETYEVLSDEKKRRDYDASGGSAHFHHGGGRAGNFHFNFEEFFSQFEDDIFGADMKSHFSSHFDSHFRSHAEATGGAFAFDDFLNEDFFGGDSFGSVQGGGQERCHTVTQKVGNTITSYTTCS